MPAGLWANVPARVLVAFHGMGSNGPSLGRQLIADADRHQWVVIAPTLRYDDLWNTEVVAHEDVLVSRWLREYLDNFEKERGVAIQSKSLLFGYSRGAGLVDRIAVMQPERVVAATVLSSGTSTLPLTRDSSGAPLAFPFGVADLANYTGNEFNPQAFASIRWWVGVGGKDDDVKDVPQAWSAHSGATRLERARSFTSALVLAGAEAKLSVFADTRHYLTAEMRGTAMTFLHAADPAPLVAPPVATAVVPTVTPTVTPHSPANAPNGTTLKPPPTSTPARAASSAVGHTDEALPPGSIPTPNIVPLRPPPPTASTQSPSQAEPIQATEPLAEPTKRDVNAAPRPEPMETPPEPLPVSPPPALAAPRSVAAPPALESVEPAINPPVAQEPGAAAAAPPADIRLAEPPPGYGDGSVAPDPMLLP